MCLSEGAVTQALKALKVAWLDRELFAAGHAVGLPGPSAKPGLFPSCSRCSFDRTYHVSRGQRPCSAETGAYWQARKRRPEEFFSKVARQTGGALDDSGKDEWLRKRRRVLAYDGSTVSMPDTAENQQAYPRPPQQQPGVGFPLARMAAFFSLVRSGA